MWVAVRQPPANAGGASPAADPTRLQPNAKLLQPDGIPVQGNGIRLQPNGKPVQPDVIRLQGNAKPVQGFAIRLQPDAILVQRTPVGCSREGPPV